MWPFVLDGEKNTSNNLMLIKGQQLIAVVFTRKCQNAKKK